MTAARNVAVALLLAAPVPAVAAKRPLAPGERIDLNRAGAADLMRLPGVGREKARAILEHRARHPFRRPEEVTRVKGLSEAWYDKVKGHLAAGEVAHPPPAPEPDLQQRLTSPAPRR